MKEGEKRSSVGFCMPGVPEKGKVFCEKLPFPEDLLFLDPNRVAYRELSLYEGIGRTFFSAATPKVFIFACFDLAHTGRCWLSIGQQFVCDVVHVRDWRGAQALTGLSFDKFKDAVKDYTFSLTKPPKNDDAFQQVGGRGHKSGVLAWWHLLSY